MWTHAYSILSYAKVISPHIVKDRKAHVIRFKKQIFGLIPHGSGSSEKQSFFFFFFALLPLKSPQRFIPFMSQGCHRGGFAWVPIPLA